MNFIVSIFNTIFYQPLFNLLILIYLFLPFHDFGLSIIILTIIVHLILYPVSIKSLKSQKALKEIQPKIQEIQKKYKDKQEQAQKMLELYRKEKINPFSGVLPLLIQLPILIALYRVFWGTFQPEALTNLYSFVSNPGVLNSTFLGLVDLAKPNLILAILVGALQFLQAKKMAPKSSPETKKDVPDFLSMFQKQMIYFFPILMVLIISRLPSALSLYLITASLFTISQHYLIGRKHDVNPSQVLSSAKFEQVNK